MTTITVRAGVMAADSLETDDGTKRRRGEHGFVLSERCKKIHRLPDGRIFGSAGSSEAGQRLLLALKHGHPSPRLDDLSALLLYPDRHIELYEGSIWQRVESEYYAIGTGAPFAFAAMDAKAGAEQAARIGAFRDPFSGGRVQVLRLK